MSEARESHREEPPDPAGRLAEYNALRAEIERRSTAQQAIVALQVTALSATTALTINNGNPNLLLIMGPVSLFLALAWTDHHKQLGSVGRYIMEKIEPFVPGLGWEGWIRSGGRLSKWGYFWRVTLQPLVIFGGSSAATLVAVWLLTKQQTGRWFVWWFTVAVLTVATVAVVATGTRFVDDRPVVPPNTPDDEGGIR